MVYAQIKHIIIILLFVCLLGLKKYRKCSSHKYNQINLKQPWSSNIINLIFLILSLFLFSNPVCASNYYLFHFNFAWEVDHPGFPPHIFEFWISKADLSTVLMLISTFWRVFSDLFFILFVISLGLSCK